MAEWGNPAGRKSSHSFRGERTWGTETSQYLEEEKSIEMLLVAASERGPAQTALLCGRGVVGLTYAHCDDSGSCLERHARDGDSPVRDIQAVRSDVPE
jgi:hypothetical protein